MSSSVIVYKCSCESWLNTDYGDECSCGKRVFSKGDIFSEVEPEYTAVEEVHLDFNKVISFLKANGNIEDFKPDY
jgi:hypothetical protein